MSIHTDEQKDFLLIYSIKQKSIHSRFSAGLHSRLLNCVYRRSASSRGGVTYLIGSHTTITWLLDIEVKPSLTEMGDDLESFLLLNFFKEMHDWKVPLMNQAHPVTLY